MRVLIVLPRQDRATGNEVTAHRHQDGLRALGHTVDLHRAAPTAASELRAAAGAFRPDVVHLLHAYRSGRPWLEADLAALAPMVVTLTGTDVHGGVDDPDQGPVIGRVLVAAGALVLQDPTTAEAFRHRRPDLAGRVRYLRPGTVLGRGDYPPLRPTFADADAVLLLHPAGLRPVKGNLELLEWLTPLAGAVPGFQHLLCGPGLDGEYARQVLAAVAERPWAHHLGTVPPDAMPALLRQVDVVCNHSLSEGLPNTLVEAVTLGVPMLARNIPGNAAVVEHGVNGLLYRDQPGFEGAARALLTDPVLRQRLGMPRPDRYDPARESRDLEAIYVAVLG